MKHKFSFLSLLAAAVVIAIMANFGAWLVKDYHINHSDADPDTGMTTTMTARLTTDRSSNLRGTIYDAAGRVLAETELIEVEIPVKTEDAEDAKEAETEPKPTKKEKADEEEASNPWEGDNFWAAFGAFRTGTLTPAETEALEEEKAVESSSKEGKYKIVKRRHVTDEYSHVLSSFLSPYDFEHRYDLELVNGNFSPACMDAKMGNSFNLTLDAELSRFMAETLITAGVTKGGAVMLDVETGAIIGMVSLPTNDINAIYDSDTEAIEKYEEQDKELYYNEMTIPRNLGSSVKPITALPIIRSGISLEFTEQNALKIGNSIVNDAYGARHDGEWLNLALAMKYSSNTYFASKLVEASSILSVTDEMAKLYLNSDQNIPTDFCTLKSTYDFTSVEELGMAAYGQAQFTLSPLQLAMCYAAIATGDLMQPYLVDEIVSPNGKTVFKSEPTTLNAKTVSSDERAKLKDALLSSGNNYSGLNNSGSSFSIAAKSGTAQVVNNKGKRVNTVMGSFFPADKPRYALVVMQANDPVTNHAGSNHAASIRSIANYAMTSLMS